MFVPRALADERRHSGEDYTATYEVLECPSCKNGTVANRHPIHYNDPDHRDLLLSGHRRIKIMHNLSPGSLPAPRVSGMPPTLEGAWEEVLLSGQAGAWTASELMCRKILMHVAVDKFKAPEGEAFTVYVKALDEAHFFPKMLQPLLDGIRERGNRATHDVAASPERQAIKTIQITHHVLRTIYELANV